MNLGLFGLEPQDAPVGDRRGETGWKEPVPGPLQSMSPLGTTEG